MSQMTVCDAPQLQMPHSFTDIHCSICIGYRPIDPSHNSALISDIPCIPLPSPLPATPPHSPIPSSYLRSFLSPDGRTNRGRVRPSAPMIAAIGHGRCPLPHSACSRSPLAAPPPHLGRHRSLVVIQVEQQITFTPVDIIKTVDFFSET